MDKFTDAEIAELALEKMDEEILKGNPITGEMMVDFFDGISSPDQQVRVVVALMIAWAGEENDR